MVKGLYQILKENFGLTEDQFSEIDRIKKEKGGSINDILLNRKLIPEKTLLEARSVQYGIPFWPDLPFDSKGFEFTRHISIQFLKKFIMVPLVVNGNGNGNGLDGSKQPQNQTIENDKDQSQEAQSNEKEKHVIALHDPTHFQPLDDLIRILKLKEVQIVLSTKDAILSAINISYDMGRDSAEELVQNMEESGETIIDEIEETSDLLDDTSDAPIIKLVNHIISQSTKARASDIHIEPFQDSFKVRYRVDGILYDLLTPPRWIQPALTSRIKVMAKMNIAEKRLPQDGRFDVKIGDQDIDVRVSTIPTSFGERVVLRLLNKSGSLLKIKDLGLLPQRLKQIEELVRSPHGIILVTGPTGSGKTTTLYAILSSIHKPDINIITVEDPVEYQIKGISQIQVNPKINLSFARGLRSIVRQDPDVILIGEIRDRETAEIAVQSALTGHLVFSTLHTNDSASAITRLVDIGVEPFLISSSVISVVAQRLARVLCDHCKEPYVPDELALNTIGMSLDETQNSNICKATGCEACFHTGYKGRIGIFEIMVLNENLKSLILKTYDSNVIKKEAQKSNMISLRQDGIHKILKGMTTVEEMLRVTQT